MREAYDGVEIRFHELFLCIGYSAADKMPDNGRGSQATHVEINLIEVAVWAEDDVHIIEAGDLARYEAKGDRVYAFVHTFL